MKSYSFSKDLSINQGKSLRTDFSINKKTMKMNQFSTEPNYNGDYNVIRRNLLTNEWEVIETYNTEEEAKVRAKQLNDENC